MNTFNLTLDLAKAKQRQQQTIFVRQGDQNGTTIVATITDHGAAAATSGMTARFQMRLPDGTHYYRKDASLSGNVATVALDEAQAASAVGRTDVAYFQLLQGSTVVASTESFTVIVLPDALADATVPESYDSAIQEAIGNLNDAVEQLPSTVEDVLADHPEWTTTVQDGSITKDKLATDLARDRERLLYRLDNLLTNALPEGETATASDAAKTPIAGLALYGRSTQDGTPTPSTPVPIVSVEPNPVGTTTWTIGGIDGGTGAVVASNTRIHTDMMPVVGGKTYTLTFDNKDTYDLEVYQYAADGSYNATTTAWRSSPYTLVLSGTTAFVRLLARNKANTAVNPSAAAGFKARLFRGAFPAPFVVSAGVWAKGRNLLPSDAGFWRNNGIDGGTGDYASNSVTRASTDTIPVLPSTTYTISAASGTRFAIYQYTADGGYIRVTYGWWTVSHSFTTQAGTAGLRVLISNPDDSTVSLATIADRRLQIELGSTATAYQPYVESVQPVPLDGHELRSLPDGTRDELTVDERGHAVLVQRVGSIEGADLSQYASSGGFVAYRSPVVSTAATSSNVNAKTFCTWSNTSEGFSSSSMTKECVQFPATNAGGGRCYVAAANGHDLSDFLLLYQLATPVTHDLGTIDPVPLVGPDLTAQAIPTAPFALTYERDLNATLARLESAIATLA